MPGQQQTLHESDAAMLIQHSMGAGSTAIMRDTQSLGTNYDVSKHGRYENNTYTGMPRPPSRFCCEYTPRKGDGMPHNHPDRSWDAQAVKYMQGEK